MGDADRVAGGETGGRAVSRAMPVIMLLIVGIGFGAMFSVNRIAATNGVPPIAYAFWQSLGAGVILLVICVVRRELPVLSPIHLRTYGVLGVIGIGIPISLLTYVAPNVPASVLSLGQVLVPMLTYIFALLIRMEQFRWISVFGILLGFLGVLLVILPESSLPSRDMVGWLLLAFLAPVCFATCNVFAGRFRPPEAPSTALSCGLLIASAIFLLPIMFASGQAYSFMDGAPIGNWMILLATLINVVFWVLFFEIIRLAGPIFFAQFNYLSVLAGMGWAILIFGDRPSAYIWGALVLLFGGITLVQIGLRRALRQAA